jgi:hypothetical protein
MRDFYSIGLRQDPVVNVKWRMQKTPNIGLAEDWSPKIWEAAQLNDVTE